MIIFLFLFIISVKAQDNVLCVPHQYKSLFERTISNNKYLRENTIDCINSIKNGSKIFTISSTNELSLINWDDVYVFGEFKRNETAFDESQSTVVITTKEVNLKYFKGLRYCHPGEKVTTPPWVTNEFITTILDYQKNDRKIFKNETLLDYDYYVLNSTLGPSCLQNVWSDDEHLKKIYPKLFALCPLYNPKYNAFEQSLLCLTNGDGDIAVTSLEMVHKHEQEILSRSNLYSFCKNDTHQKLDNPCLWRSTSWPVLIGNKNNEERLHEIIEALNQFHLFPNNTSLSNYIQPFNENAIYNPSNNTTLSTKQNRTLSWCTLTKEEYENCLLLQKIFSSYDIHIKITSCVNVGADQTDFSDKYNCIKNMSEGRSSVTYLHSDHLFTAKRSNLMVALYANTDQNVIKSIMFVNSTNITNINDLRSKNGCFSEYGSIDWVSFVSAYKTEILNTSRFYDVELSKFLGDSCMPGINDNFRDLKDDVDLERICNICQSSPEESSSDKNCKANRTENIYATNFGAMQCLSESAGQLAVIKIDNIMTTSSDIKIGKDIKVMCKNGNLLDFNEIDDECYLSITPYGGIVTKKELHGDVKLAFSELKRRNSQYGWLPNEYISNVFKDLFLEEFIIDFLDIATCNETPLSDFCRYSLKLENMIEEIDSFPNEKRQDNIHMITQRTSTYDDSIVTRNEATVSTTIQPDTNSPKLSTINITILSIISVLIVVAVIGFYYRKKYKIQQNTTNTSGDIRRSENENETNHIEMVPLTSHNRSEQ